MCMDVDSLNTVVITANLRTKILDFRGFDSSRILILRGLILVSTGSFSESTNLSRDTLSREIGSRDRTEHPHPHLRTLINFDPSSNSRSSQTEHLLNFDRFLELGWG